MLSLKQGDTSNVVGMRIVGANPASRPVGLDKQAGVSNYFVGNDPSKWHTNVANYSKAGYQDVYRGINLVYHGDQKQLEYDFTVRPGADPRAIRLDFDGTQGKALDAQGNLVLHTSAGDVVEHAPVAYQMIHGVQHTVASRFVLNPHGQVGFHVGRYDHVRPLVIDPVLSYSTYLGGRANDRGSAIAVDSSGNAYVTEVTASTNFPTINSLQPVYGGNGDAFVTKFDASGSALLYSTYLGGNGSDNTNDNGGAIAVDTSGNVYVTGFTFSTNFPTLNAFQPTYGGSGDAFVAKINPSQSGTASLLYSSYLGGSGGGGDEGYGIAVDGLGNSYVTGETASTDFPFTQNAFQTKFGGPKHTSDAFVTKITAS